MGIKKWVFAGLLIVTNWGVAQQTKSGEAVDCSKYWIRQDSLNKIMLDYFKNQIIDVASRKKDIPQENLEFLKELYRYLNLTRDQQAAIAALRKPIFPIFRLNDGRVGVISFPQYKCSVGANNVTQCEDISAEKTALRKAESMPSGSGFDIETEFTPDTKVFSQLVTNKTIQIYTTSTNVIDQVTLFSNYVGECLEYYHYQLRNQIIKEPLFGTYFELKLKYGRHHEIDQTMERQFAAGCYDCQFKYEPVTTFATLQGIDNIYFSYTDTFLLNNQFDYPERAILMRIADGTVVTLWAESVDLFGCACL